MLLRAALVLALAVIPLASAATQITNVCDAQFCLASSPAACGGQCFLTAASGDSSFCSTKCQASWYNPTVMSCLSNQAVGVFVSEQITALYDKCNAAAIAAAKLNASTVKYETLFPCTKTLTSTQFDPEGLDTCGLVANATCSSTCSAAIDELPATCSAQFSANATWAAVIKSCAAAAPAPTIGITSPIASAPGAGSGLTPSGGLAGLGLSPTGSPSSPSSTPSAASVQAALGAPMLVLALVSGLLYVLA